MSIVPALERVMENFKTNPSTLMIGGSLMIHEREELDEFFIEKAKRELRETPEVAEEALKILLDLLAEEENLFVPMEKEFLQTFLRKCKWYPESAFETIKEYYNYRESHPEFYEHYLPSKVENFFLSGIFTTLPRRTAKGERVILLQAGFWNTNEVSLNQILAGLLMFVDVAAAELKTQVAGVHVILDVGSLGLNHVASFSPWSAKAIVDFSVKCSPVRLKGFHVVNNPYYFFMIFAFFKPFLNAKFRDRILIHGNDSESILKHIDANALPTRYGGELDFPDEPIREPMYKFASNFEEYFEDTKRFGYITER